MKILFDTSVIIYFALDDAKLKSQTRELIVNSENYVSSVSIWEILQKTKTGKLKLPEASINVIENLMEALNASFLNFTAADAIHLEKLPDIHKDPFDRMLICQSINNGIALVTDDKFIAKYPIKTIW